MNAAWHEPGAPGRHWIADPVGHVAHRRAVVPDVDRQWDPCALTLGLSGTCCGCRTPLNFGASVPMDGPTAYCLRCAGRLLAHADPTPDGRVWSVEVCSCPPCMDKAIADGRRRLARDAARSRATSN